MEHSKFYTSHVYEIYGIYDPRDQDTVIVIEVVDLVAKRVAYISWDLGVAFIDSMKWVITETSSAENDEKFLSGFFTWWLCTSLTKRH
jgi:hypothetical protein